MNSPLSAKAKGKQRAVDPFDGEQGSSDLTRELTIRFTEGTPDLVLQVRENDTIRDLRRAVSVVCVRISVWIGVIWVLDRFGMRGHSLRDDD